MKVSKALGNGYTKSLQEIAVMKQDVERLKFQLRKLQLCRSKLQKKIKTGIIQPNIDMVEQLHLVSNSILSDCKVYVFDGDQEPQGFYAFICYYYFCNNQIVPLIHDVHRNLSFSNSCAFVQVRRVRHGAAHRVAQLARPIIDSVLWWMDPPAAISSAILAESLA